MLLNLNIIYNLEYEDLVLLVHLAFPSRPTLKQDFMFSITQMYLKLNWLDLESQM